MTGQSGNGCLRTGVPPRIAGASSSRAAIDFGRNPMAAPAADMAPRKLRRDRGSRMADSPHRGSDQLADRLGAFNADKLLVESGIKVIETVGIEAQLVEDRSMEILDMKAVF